MKEIIVKVNNGNYTLDDTIVKDRVTAYKMAEQPQNVFCSFWVIEDFYSKSFLSNVKNYKANFFNHPVERAMFELRKLERDTGMTYAKILC